MDRTRMLAIVLLGLAALVAALYAGFRAGHAYTLQSLVGSPDGGVWSRYALRYALGLADSGSDYGQDVWLRYGVFPGVDDGYFVDVGSADGRRRSNTAQLEARGWEGICIDAFPRNMAGRTCKVYREAVDREGGRSVEFHSPGSDHGGIVERAGWWVGEADRRTTVAMTTTTLADILRRAGAPHFIHYMNVDIEGSEYDALLGFPFEAYRVGAITVEHNNVETRRQRIRALLESNGYRLEWAIRDQDWYVLAAPAVQAGGG